MDTIKFEWDENKNQTNQKKHGISFEEAKEELEKLGLQIEEGEQVYSKRSFL